MFLVINLVNLLLIQIFVSINEDGFSQEVFKLVEFINHGERGGVWREKKEKPDFTKLYFNRDSDRIFILK